MLLRRLLADLGAPESAIEVIRPHRVSRNKVVKAEELERAVEITARRVGDNGAVLVLLDADQDCPAELGPVLLARAQAVRPSMAISVVLANREFESWFLAGLESLRNERSISEDAAFDGDPEAVTGAKERLSSMMARRYAETLDQPAFSAKLDLVQARRAPSFRKLVRDIERIARAIAALDLPEARNPDGPALG